MSEKLKQVYIAIPVPEPTRTYYGDLLEDLNAIDDSLTRGNMTHPHISVYYLSQHPVSELERFSEIVEAAAPLLKGCNLKFGGPKIIKGGSVGEAALFMETAPSEQLDSFRERLEQKLPEDKMTGCFSPHVTLARRRANRRIDRMRDRCVEYRIQEERWSFSPNVVGVYTRNTPFREFEIINNEIPLPVISGV